jgi:hypothetical protein
MVQLQCRFELGQGNGLAPFFVGCSIEANAERKQAVFHKEKNLIRIDLIV